jgi:hypothetical protein
MSIYPCKLHHKVHTYTVCPDCGCQYCPEIYGLCPRLSWHPNHATEAAEIGKRYQALEDVRRNR